MAPPTRSTHRRARRRRFTSIAVCFIGAALCVQLASCGGDSTGDANSQGLAGEAKAGADTDTAVASVSSEAPSTTTMPSTTAPTTTTTTTPPPPTVPPKSHTGSGQPVTLAFGGDMHFEGLLRTRLANETETMLAPVAAMMADADLAVANLETAVTDQGTPSPKQFNFRTTPNAFDALRSSGIDVVSMANNHGMDYGVVGLEDSLRYASESGFPMVGVGLNATEAYRPYSTVINEQRLAVIGATQVLDSSLIPLWTATDSQPGLASAKEVERLVAEVEAARLVHDTVIVFLHWGTEGDTCPTPRQIELSNQLVAAGADIVVGGHAHRVQGGGLKNGALIHYGLGNFVFYTASGPGTTSGVLRVTVTGRRIDEYRWIPAQLSNGVATGLSDGALEAGVNAWNGLRDCTDLTA